MSGSTSSSSEESTPSPLAEQVEAPVLVMPPVGGAGKNLMKAAEACGYAGEAMVELGVVDTEVSTSDHSGILADIVERAQGETIPEEEEGEEEKEEEDMEEEEEVAGPSHKRAKVLEGSPSRSSADFCQNKESEVLIIRDGHPEDRHFQISVSRDYKFNMDKDDTLQRYYNYLIPEEHRKTYPREMVRLRAPDKDERAHDYKNGMAIYWKMPMCGFRLTLSEFARELLTELNIAPAQLLPAAWCYVSSFEEMYRQHGAELGNQKPTIPVFWIFFSALWHSPDYQGMRKNSASPTLFDTSRSSKWNKFEDWNRGWLYLENPEDFPTLSGVRREWRKLEPLEKKPKKKKKKDKVNPTSLLEPRDQLRANDIMLFLQS